MRLTRQGVRDLGGNGQHRRSCKSATGRHLFTGPLVVIGHRPLPYNFSGDYEYEPIEAHSCLWCGAAPRSQR